MSNPLFSIIVVSLNGEKLVEKTFSSIAFQSFSDYEVVVQDGCSTDSTIKRIEKYLPIIKRLHIHSCKDNGIYDAMNSAVQKCSGEYVYFLNLGDSFASNDVLENVSRLIKDKSIVFGDVNWGNKKVVQNYKINSLFFLKERMVCHQSVFAKKQLLIDTPFDVTYRLCADRDFLYKMYKNKVDISHIDVCVCNYDENGASSNLEKYQRDSLLLIKKQFGFFGVVFVKIKRIFGKAFKRKG